MKRSLICAILLAAGLAHGQDAEKYMFPARGEDLPTGAYWWLGGPHAGHPQPKDIIVTKFNGVEWISTKVPTAVYDLDPTADKHLVYGLPVYAPSDGTIISCWRNAPEPVGDPAAKHPEVATGRITTVGNHVNILTPEGDVILLGHFQPGSVPEEICPNEDELLCDPNDPEPGCKEDVYLDPAEQTTVRKGQPVGNVGTSGNSGGPHLHLQINDYNDGDPGKSFEYSFSRTWAEATDANTDVDPDNWVRVSGEALNPNPKLLIYPDPLLRRETAVFTEGARHAAASHLQYIVTATQRGQGQLQVVSSRVDEDGSIASVSSNVGGIVDAVDIVKPYLNSEFAVGVRNGGTLKLIYYTMDSAGTLTVMSSITGPAIGPKVAMAGYGQLQLSRGVVTVAALPANSTMFVMSHQIVQTDGMDTPDDDSDDLWGFEERGTALGPIIGSEYPDVTTLENGRLQGETDQFRGAVTAIVDKSGNLRLDSFAIESDLSLTPSHSYTGVSARKVQIETVRLSSDRQIVVVAYRTGAGTLRVDSFDVSSDGAITPNDSLVEGTISDVATIQGDSRHIATAVRNGQGRLEVITFEVQADGGVRRVGSVLAGDIQTRIAGATTIAGGRRFIVTAMRLLTSGSQLTSWEANLR